MLVAVTYNLSLRKKSDTTVNTAWRKFARENGCTVLGPADNRYHWVTPSIEHNVRVRGMECNPVEYDIEGSTIVHSLYTKDTGTAAFGKNHYITSFTLYIDHGFSKMFVRLPGWRYYFMFSKTTLRRTTKVLSQTVYTENSMIDSHAEKILERCMRALSEPYAIEFASGTITFLGVGDYRDPRRHAVALNDILKFEAALL